MLRWEFTRDTRFNVPYKIEIYDSEFSGSSTDLGIVSGVPVEVTMGTRNADPLEKVKASQIVVRLWGAKGDFDDLFDRNNTRFKIKLYVDGNFESEFIPVPDTFQDYDTPGEFTVEIKAANLALLKQKQASDVISNGSRLQAIQDIINVYFDLPVVDGTVFYPKEANTSGSALSQTMIQASRLEEMNCYQALEMLIPKGHQVRITKGKAFIFPVTEASFTGYEGAGSTLYDDNFVSTKIGGRLSKTRTRLQTYDGVRRTYQPLDAENIVPSGDFELEDFGLEELPTGRTPALPAGWSPVRPFSSTTYAKLNGQDVSWQIGESVGSFIDQFALEANEIKTYQSWTAEAGQVLAGTRLKIRFTHNYESVNNFAHIPIKIKVGSQILFMGRDNSGRLVAGSPKWRAESNGLIRHVDHVLIGTRANTGYKDWEFITPPIPETGTLSVEVETPSVDRSWEPDENNFLEIAEFSIDPANESGEILVEEKVLAGSEGDVYEYTEGFGDGFSSFNPGAMFNKDEEISFTPKAENLTELWVYNGTDGSIPSTELPLAELETKYLYSQLSTDRDRKNGTVDVYDFLALIDGLRVNYISTDFRFGRSDIELFEIRDHDLEATIEERKEKKIEGVVRWEIDPPLRLFNQQQAIGETTEDYINETRTSAGVEIDNPVQAGGEYWIVNENEVSSTDRLAGVYPIIPQRTDEAGNVVLPDDPGYEDAIKNYGPGRLDGDVQARLPIEEQRINAPKGSLIFKGPNQNETETIIIDRRVQEGEEAIDTLNTVTLPALQADLDQLETDLDTLNTVTLPGLQDDLDQLETDLNTLNTVTLPGLQDDLDALNTELDAVLPITETKISDGAISTPKLQTNAVTAGKILAGSITTNKIAAGAVVADSIASNAIIANKIQSGAIITDKIGAGQIATFHLQADIITANEIGADVIRGFHIRAGEIDTEHLEANAVTANKIDVADLYATDATIAALLNVGGVAYIGAGVDVQESNGQRALMGTTLGGVPYFRAQRDSSNFAQMVGASGSNNFFEARSAGNVVMAVNSSGLTIDNADITFSTGIGGGGLIFNAGNVTIQDEAWVIRTNPTIDAIGVAVTNGFFVKSLYVDPPSGAQGNNKQVYYKNGNNLTSFDRVLCVDYGN